jgi:hypothetical protein
MAKIKTKSERGLFSVRDKLPVRLIMGTDVNRVGFKAYRVGSTLNGSDRYNEVSVRLATGWLTAAG